MTIEAESAVPPKPPSMLSRVRGRVASALNFGDDLATRLALASKSWLLWPVLYAIALGAGAWSLHRKSLLQSLDSNKLGDGDRKQALVWLGGAAAAILITYLTGAIVVRIRSGAWRNVEAIATLNRWLQIVLAAPFVAYLRLPSIEKDSPKLTLFCAAVTAAIVTRALYLWQRPPAPPGAGAEDPPRRRWLAWAAWLAPLCVLLFWVGYGWLFSHLSITNHHALNTRTTDLGYYDNIFYQSIHGKPLGCSFIKAGSHVSAHFDPILVLLSPLYLIHPRAELILALQSIWLGSGVVPAYLIGRRVMASRPAGVVLAAMFALYPALHGANMYEFHSLTLISPLVLWLLYFFEVGATKRYFLALALLLLCREDVPLLMCAVGFYVILTRRPGASKQGVATILLSITYFVIVKAVFMKSSGIMNAGKDAYSYDYYYDAMNPARTGLGGLLQTIVTNPVFTLKTALDEPKVMYLVLLFLPLGLLPALARPGRVMLAYGLLFTLLASRGPVFSIHFQYSSVIFPIAFFLTAVALQQIEEGRVSRAAGLDGRRLSRALLGGAFAATLLVSWKFGGILDNQSFKGGFSRVTRTLTDEQKKTYAWVNEQATSIPKSASVGTTNKMGPHVSNRKTAVFWPEKQAVDYVFIDESELKATDLEKHNKAIGRNQLVEVARRGKMALWKKKER